MNTNHKAQESPSSRLTFWQHQFIHPNTGHKTTWKFRLVVLGLLAALAVATRAWWVPAMGWGLVSIVECEKPDVLVVDNLDTNYQLFESAANLKKHRAAKVVLIPVNASDHNPEMPNAVSQGIADLMVRLARLDAVQTLPVKEIEPITLNVARQVGDFLRGTNTKTVLILTSGFKSRRIHLIFNKVLSEIGIETYCLPVWGHHRPENWAETWHGIQEVFLQLVKLGYYEILFMGNR